MEVKKEIIEKLIGNIEWNLDNVVKNTDELKNSLAEARTVEEVVRSMQWYLLRSLSTLPWGPQMFYFCLDTDGYKEEDICNDCPYGKVHGKCAENRSDYQSVNDMLVLLWQRIVKKYYKGERYNRTK